MSFDFTQFYNDSQSPEAALKAVKFNLPNIPLPEATGADRQNLLDAITTGASDNKYKVLWDNARSSDTMTGEEYSVLPDDVTGSDVHLSFDRYPNRRLRKDRSKVYDLKIGTLLVYPFNIDRTGERSEGKGKDSPESTQHTNYVKYLFVLNRNLAGVRYFFYFIMDHHHSGKSFEDLKGLLEIVDHNSSGGSGRD